MGGQGDLFPGLGKAAKLAGCRRGKPLAWSACLPGESARAGLALRQVIEFNRIWPGIMCGSSYKKFKKVKSYFCLRFVQEFFNSLAQS